LETYGADFEYDDFIPSFDGSKFDADEWARLIVRRMTDRCHGAFARSDARLSFARPTAALNTLS
jgi:hypothetical protein